MMRTILVASVLIGAVCAQVSHAADPSSEGFWIWHESVDASKGVPTGATVYLRRHLKIDGPIAQAWIRISADDAYELYVNGKRVGAGSEWAQPDRYDLAPLLVQGDNVLAIKANNGQAGPAGVFFSGRVTYKSGKAFDFASDKTTLAALTVGKGWEQPGADEAGFSPAREMVPRFGGPWGGGSGASVDVDATLKAWDKEWQHIFAAQSTLADPILIPRPKRLAWRGGYLPIEAGGKGAVRFATPAGAQAEQCADFLRKAAGWLAGKRVVWPEATSGPVISLGIDSKIKGAEAYSVRWDAPTHVLRVTASTGRGLTWATYALAQSMVKRGTGVELKLADIDDAPAVAQRGIVIGVPIYMLPWAAYYRYNVNGMTVGMTDHITAEYGRLRREAERLGVDLVLFNHVPVQFSYSDDASVEAYCDLVRAAAAQGFRYFSLDVDDHPNETVTEADIAKYGKGLVALGHGQMDLVRKMDAAAAGKIHLIFCPRVYFDPTRTGPTTQKAPPADLEYRALVGRLPADISIWTTQPTPHYLRELRGVYHRKPLVWHNYWLDFSQCGEFYFMPYPELPPENVALAEGYWVEQDMVGNPGRANYLIHAATLWNPAARPTWPEVFAREFGAPAAAAMTKYAQLLGCGPKSVGILADWWNQPPSHLGVALGTRSGGGLTTLKPKAANVAVLRRRAADAREAMALQIAGLDRATATALRTNAEKIAINYELFAAKLGLPAMSANERAKTLSTAKTGIDRLAALGAASGYIAGWRKWLADAGGVAAAR